MATFRTSILFLTLLVLAFPAQGQERGSAPVGHDWVTVSVQAGAGGPKAANLVGGSLEVFPGQDYWSIYLTGGYGTIILGAGTALYSDRNGTGLFASATGGIIGAHAQTGMQIKITRNVFLSAGLGYGVYFLQHEGFLPFAGLEWRP